jgi:hypothetical protein
MQVLHKKPTYFILFFFGLFRNRSVCFGCFDIDPKIETNRKINLLVSRNKPKNNRNRLSFGLFRFEPKIYFICFEDTLVVTKLTASGWKQPTPYTALLGEWGRGSFLCRPKDLLSKKFKTWISLKYCIIIISLQMTFLWKTPEKRLAEIQYFARHFWF